MKLLFAFLMLPINAVAQDMPFKGAEKIIVTVDTTGLMDRLNLVLIEKGYIIEERNDRVGYIITKSKSVGYHAGRLKVRGIIRKDALELTGQTTELGAKSSANEDLSHLKFVGAKGSFNKDSWKELENIATQFGKELQYK